MHGVQLYILKLCHGRDVRTSLNLHATIAFFAIYLTSISRVPTPSPTKFMRCKMHFQLQCLHITSIRKSSQSHMTVTHRLSGERVLVRQELRASGLEARPSYKACNMSAIKKFRIKDFQLF